MKQLSIIIPTYNMEKYLHKCLDSLLIPELDEIEIIVVNDGSKDNSSKIGHDYENRFPNSIRIIDKENGNYGSCINVALKIATGRYLRILDSDDSYDSESLRKFITALHTTNADVLITDYHAVDENGRILMKSSAQDYNIIPSHVYRFEDLVNEGNLLHFQMHSLAYHRRIFDRFKYNQTEGISFTDTEWNNFPICYADTFEFLNVGYLYRYLIGREGQTVDPKRFNKQVSDYMTLFRARVKFQNSFIKSCSDNNKIQYIHNRTVKTFQEIYKKILCSENISSKRLLIDFDKWLSHNGPKIYNDLNSIRIHKNLRYYFIKDLRTEYNEGYRIPPFIFALVKILNFIEYRFFIPH